MYKYVSEKLLHIFSYKKNNLIRTVSRVKS
jgi:hypothetical protein